MPGAASKAGSFLTRKIGPLPGWAYLAGAGVVAYMYFKKQSPTAAATAGDGTAGGASAGFGGGGVGGYYGSPMPPSVDPAPKPSTPPTCPPGLPCIVRGRWRDPNHGCRCGCWGLTKAQCAA